VLPQPVILLLYPRPDVLCTCGLVLRASAGECRSGGAGSPGGLCTATGPHDEHELR
jgi:hypothetical protein